MGLQCRGERGPWDEAEGEQVSEPRKIGHTISVTPELLEHARQDFIANMGMTPEEFRTVMADNLARAFDRAVEDGEA